MHLTSPPLPLSSQRWYWTVPYVAIVVLVVTALTIVLMLQSRGSEERREMAVRDVQWAEQTIRLHKQGTESFLQKVVADIVGGELTAETFNENVTRYIASEGHIIEAYWISPEGKVNWVAPLSTSTSRPGTELDADELPPFERAKELGVVSYGKPLSHAWPVFPVHVPVRDDEEFLGTVVGVFSPRAMLAELVPDWFAERYQVSLVSDRGYAIARSQVDLPLDETVAFEVPLDLPGAGLVLRAVAFETPERAHQAVFLVIIAGLATIVLWSLWLLREHMQRRRVVEDALREESSFRKAMEESVITGLRAIDLSGRIIYVNPAFCNLVGFSETELLGATPPFPYWPEDAYAECRKEIQRSSEGPEVSSGFDLRIRRASGERVDARFYLSPLIDVNGKQRGWMASVADVTEPKRVRAALEESQRRFEAVLDGLEAAVFVADAASEIILYANRAFMQVYGREVVGYSMNKVLEPQPDPSDYLVDPRSLDASSLPMELFDGELQHSVSGRWYHLREHASMWVDGRIVRMGIATDITERRQAEDFVRSQEERLQHTARLVTMGEMASTLAHELNQPLSAISNYCMGCVTRLENGRAESQALLDAMNKASRQAERAAKIIGRVRDFVRKSEPRRTPIDIAETLDDAIAFVDLGARRGVGRGRVVLQIEPDLKPVFADRIMVEQVVVNLVRNALDAMTNIPSARRVVTVRAVAHSNDAVRIEVADCGPGIAPDEREKLFRPFHTTKPEGMGMGLNICRSIIEYHDSHLDIADNPGGGTVFSFVLYVGAAREQVA